MKTKIKKILRPIEIDASFKYICPNSDCQSERWLFLRETQVKNFKVVCECGTVFKPKRIKNLIINYLKKDPIAKPVDKSRASVKMNSSCKAVSDAIKMMISLGYNKNESTKYVNMAYTDNNQDTSSNLVKKAISKIGGI